MAPKKQLTAKKKEDDDQGAKTAPAQLVLSAEPKTMLDGNLHVGFAVGLKTNDNPSALVLPDVAAAVAGTAPVYLAKPLRIEFKKILTYLDAKQPGTAAKINDMKALKGFIQNTAVAFDSFYYRKGAAAVPAKPAEGNNSETKATAAVTPLLLMQFEIDFTGEKGGLIGALTDDADLSALFEVTSISLRALKCDEDSVETLQNYIDALAAD